MSLLDALNLPAGFGYLLLVLGLVFTAFRVLNPDNKRMAMTRGEYPMLVTHSEIKNVIEHAGPLPPDDEVTVRLA